jgi:Pyruvate/2-oxoacid:ferredoxin oxidoreductase gamma subunit
VQRELREIEGVTLLIYDQTCAAEKRRRARRRSSRIRRAAVFINEAVCEGCGDCGQASNCLSVVPVETDWGRKRHIEQSSCNKDYSCINGFCPSFVTLDNPVLKRKVGASLDPARVAAEIERVGRPAPWSWTGPFDLLVTGVGGTGVVTVGALITMAAHLEGKQASVLDFMGFAQKGGAVLSFVRVAPTADQLNQVRIDTQQADVLLACDLVVGASADALGTVKHGRTVVLANTHELATAAFVRNPDASLQARALLEKLRHAAGDERVSTLDAQDLAQNADGRHDAQQHRDAGRRLPARPGAGQRSGAAARDRAERRRDRIEQARLCPRPPGRGRSAGAAAAGRPACTRSEGDRAVRPRWPGRAPRAVPDRLSGCRAGRSAIARWCRRARARSGCRASAGTPITEAVAQQFAACWR